jgi:hypothetical protein
MALMSCLLAFGLVFAQGYRTKIDPAGSIWLPQEVILDERSLPALDAAGKVGFVSSATEGSLIAFSLASGKVLSRLIVGRSAGPVSIAQVGRRRILAVPAPNDPDRGLPATLNIIDATKAAAPELLSVIALPTDAHITTSTRALITKDARFAIIASSFEDPTLFSFDLRTGQMLSSLQLPSRPSLIEMQDDLIAISSPASNSLFVAQLDPKGQLHMVSIFLPDRGRFGEYNNPAFSPDGATIYIAAAEGDLVFAIEAKSGIELSRAKSLPTPQRISVASGPEGDLIGAVGPKGVTILESIGGKLALKAEFAPPNPIGFSPANNVAIDAANSMAFVGSANGMLFAFDLETGELQSHYWLGRELLGLSMSQRSRKIVAVRRTPDSDQIAILSFELEGKMPIVKSLRPDNIQQQPSSDVAISIEGQNLVQGSRVLAGQLELAATVAPDGKSLSTKLPKSLLDQPGHLSIRVRNPDGTLSQPVALEITKPSPPVIEGVMPRRIPGRGFYLEVRGRNFRQTSAVFVEGRMVPTSRLSQDLLQARVSADLASRAKSLKVEVRDLAIADLASNFEQVRLFGPRIEKLLPSARPAVAGARGFYLRIIGENFRPGASVEINGQKIPSWRVRRLSSSAVLVMVPGKYARKAGDVSVSLRNPDGGASSNEILKVCAPEISGFNPAQLVAGAQSARLVIRGAFFRNGSRVVVGAEGLRPLELSWPKVRFCSSSLLVVNLKGDLGALLERPGQLSFQVINQGGIASRPQKLALVGPSISSAQVVAQDNGILLISVLGENFRSGALVEFVKSGSALYRQVPARMSRNQLILTAKPKLLEALGRFQIRVVNPGGIASNAVEPSWQ